MATEGPVVATQVGGWMVESNSGASASDISENLAPKESGESEEPDPSKAASELGKLGGKASAKARAKAEKEAKKAEKAAAPESESGTENPEVEAKGEEAEPEKAEEKPEEKPLGKPRDDPRARMLEATRKEAEAKRALAAEREERARERAELAQLKADIEALKAGKAAPAEDKAEPKRNAKPSPEEFEKYEDYLDARDEWNRSEWEAKTKREREQSESERQVNAMFETFYNATSEIRDTIRDTVGQLRSSWQLRPGEREDASNWLANELLLAPQDYSPEIARALALHLHEHKDELQRIAALKSPRAVTRELASIVTRLEAATTGTSSETDRPVSKAPPPIKPVAGAPYVAESDDFKPGESFDAYYARMKKKKS